MNDVRSWDCSGGEELLSNLETTGTAIADLGERIISNLESLHSDPASADRNEEDAWLSEIASNVRTTAAAVKETTAAVARYGDAMIEVDAHYGKLIAGD
ncbi:hypothetical protein [Mycolicibacterium mageritense]|uniref:hypothetical protein n=1 Tax=Mycolicibacterium mageritense TaxID=53462 RepID=UPI001E47004B|nr:hypothetical protein [Mycolicibacterium mageritense]MCC9184820.1 hypothetical protein [Mycolicibacterium mageritense]